MTLFQEYVPSDTYGSESNTVSVYGSQPSYGIPYYAEYAYGPDSYVEESKQGSVCGDDEHPSSTVSFDTKQV